MHNKTKTNTELPQTLGSTLNNRFTTTEPHLRTDSNTTRSTLGESIPFNTCRSTLQFYLFRESIPFQHKYDYAKVVRDLKRQFLSTQVGLH